MSLKLDLGCGPNPREGFEGVDQYAFGGKVKHVLNLAETNASRTGYIAWPWPDFSVDEAISSHFIEHLPQSERCWFFNELHRILKPNAKAQIIVPHWACHRAYGDPTHAWPPIGEMFWLYLNREWRLREAPHTDASNWPLGYSCDFNSMWGYSFRNDPEFMGRADAYKQFAMANYRDTVWDMIVTCTRRPDPAEAPK